MTRAGVLLVALAALGPSVAAQTATVPAGVLAYRLPGRPLDALDARPQGAGAARPDSLRPPDLWLGPDKALHAGGSFLFTLSAQYALTDKAGLSDAEALPVSAAVAFALGIAKEVRDSRRAVAPHFSLRDLAADALGVALAAVVTRL